LENRIQRVRFVKNIMISEKDALEAGLEKRFYHENDTEYYISLEFLDGKYSIQHECDRCEFILCNEEGFILYTHYITDLNKLKKTLDHLFKLDSLIRKTIQDIDIFYNEFK